MAAWNSFLAAGEGLAKPCPPLRLLPKGGGRVTVIIYITHIRPCLFPSGLRLGHLAKHSYSPLPGPRFCFPVLLVPFASSLVRRPSVSPGPFVTLAVAPNFGRIARSLESFCSRPPPLVPPWLACHVVKTQQGKPWATTADRAGWAGGGDRAWGGG